MGEMFELLKEGLEEALEFVRGNVKCRTKMLSIGENMKFINNKPEETLHVFAKGNGSETHIRLYYLPKIYYYDEGIQRISLNLEEAKQLIESLKEVIIEAEIRSNKPDYDD